MVPLRLAGAALACALLLLLPAAAHAAPRDGLPRPFLWGQSLSGFQAEMGQGRDLDRGSDWWAWVHDRGNIDAGVVSGDLPENGPGFWRRYREDVALARRGAGANLFRISIEWSRLFPRRPSVPAGAATSPRVVAALRRQADPRAVRRYRQILRAIRARGMRPFVTLNHFTLPLWVHDPFAVRAALRGRGPDEPLPALERGGWLSTRTVTDFGRYAAWAGATFGDLVDLWAPINEPMVVATNGYANIPGVVEGNFPPGVFSFTGAITAVRRMEEGNTAAFDALKRTDRRSARRGEGPATVGLVQNMIGFTPADPARAQDVAATGRAEYLFNRLFATAAVTGDNDRDADGVIEPGERRVHGRKADFVGVNYYFRGRVTGAGAPLSAQIPVLDFLPATTYRWARNPAGPPCPTVCSDFGNELYAQGLRRALQIAGSYGLPVIVTETGMADADDDARPAFLRDHLAQVRAAMRAKEADVRGVIHWSITDNFEWVAGYAPRFGLYGYDARTLRRTPRAASLRVLRAAARGGRP